MIEDLRRLAHQSLAQSLPPYLRFQKRSAFAVREGVAMTAQDMQGAGFNFAAALGPAPPTERVIDLGEEFFAGRPGGYGILVEGDAGHPVEAGLKERGWQVVEDEPALVLPSIPAPPPLPEGLEVRLVLDSAGRKDFSDAVHAGFGSPPGAYDDLLPPLASLRDPDVALLVGYVGGQAVTVATFYVLGPAPVIAGVCTLPDWRRRGFGRAITWAALAEAARRGHTCAVLRASPMSFSLYVSMGFVHVCQHRTYALPGVKA